jgi:hypothetical protein
MRYKLDFSLKIQDLDGQAIRLGADPRVLAEVNLIAPELEQEPREKLAERLDKVWGAEQTLATICVAALLAPHEQEKGLGDDERIRRFELSRRLNKGGLQEFNDKERDLLKKVVGMRFLGSLVSPTVWEMLEGAERLGELKEVNGGQAGRASIAAIAAVLAITLSGCAAGTLYVQQHSAGLAATALVAGTVSQVGGALIKVDELAERAEQRIEKEEKR